MRDRPSDVLSDSEPIQRLDGWWGMATYRHGVREIFGRFESHQEALTWIKKSIETVNSKLPSQTAPGA
jgi:hypothetical protein